ncbi:CUB domain-containing protein 1 [Anolis sagrei]|uniref:CUB domain-containing protein 1 n=1 Tax=Anolis sagrei TaxID=38937 RepID=UPI00351FEFDE
MAPERRMSFLFFLVAAGLSLVQGAGAFEINLFRIFNVTIWIKPGYPDLKTCGIRTGGKQYFSEQKINPGERPDFTFSCSTPERHWVLLVEKNIDCMSGQCPFGDVLLQPFGLPSLNRTFVWDVKVDQHSGIELKFSPSLKQIQPGDTCSDQVLYHIGSRLNRDKVNIGNFCRNGSVSRVKVQGGVILTLQLPWNSKYNTSGFKLENRSSIQRLCIIESMFQNESSTTLMSANYPLGFPEDELMTWQFVIPSNLRARVFIKDYIKPNCERKFVKLELYSGQEKVLVLDKGQTANVPGSFNLSLQGCDQIDENPGVLGVLFDVTTHYPKNEENVTIILDLRKEKNMNVTIYSKPTRPESFPKHEQGCSICIDSSKNCKPNVTLQAAYKYSVIFMCRNLENIRMIAEKSIVCWDSRSCYKDFPLVVPQSLTELRILIEKFIWKLQAPTDLNIEIRSPFLKLKQHIPQKSQLCSGSYSYTINGTTPGRIMNYGHFCPGGAIEKIVTGDNVTITLKTYGDKWFTEFQKQDLHLSFVPKITDDCIFSLTPDPKAKVYLETPDWLKGFPAHKSVYWNISVPRKRVGQLDFLSEKMGVTCVENRAHIYIREHNPEAKEIVCRDDEKLPRALEIRDHFWVNITNCKPIAGKLLSMQFMVTLVEKNTALPIIIGAVVGVIAVLAVIGLIIFCMKKKKNGKKEGPTPMVGVYNTNVNTQLPGRKGLFKKDRKNNESHIYAVIDESMVYGHLLDTSTIPETAAVGVYQPFSGPMSTKPPSPPPLRKASKEPNMEESSFMLLTDNENYTFTHRSAREPQSNGDVNVSGNVGSKPLLEDNGQENSAL